MEKKNGKKPTKKFSLEKFEISIFHNFLPFIRQSVRFYCHHLQMSNFKSGGGKKVNDFVVVVVVVTYQPTNISPDIIINDKTKTKQ